MDELEARNKQLEPLIYELEELNNEKDNMGFLEKNLKSHTAMFGYDTQGKNPCEDGTREAELKDIIEWLNTISLGSPNFLWLTGDPGCGKSAITASVAAYCRDKGILWAQFFVNRNIVQTSDPKSFFPTISLQLAEFSPAVESAIEVRLRARPTLADRMTPDQATHLFHDALVVAASLDPSKVVAVIIDGLDEIKREKRRETASILSHLFISLSQFPNAKVLISSRTEDDIRKQFYQQMQDSKVKLVHLDTTSSIKDVDSFLRKQLEKIAEVHELDKDIWPTEQQMQNLVIRSSGLFIWAVTALKYINERLVDNGSECVEMVIDEITSEELEELNELYTLILQSSQKKQEKGNDWTYKRFRRIVGAVVVLRQPLTLYHLSGLLDLHVGLHGTRADIINFVRRYRTVLVSGIEAVNDSTIPRLHSSFVDFITNADLFSQGRLSLDNRFCVDPGEAEAELAVSCLGRISNAFKVNGTTALQGGLEYAIQFCLSHVNAVIKSTTASVAFVLPDPKMEVEDEGTLARSIASQNCSSLTPWFPIDFIRSPSAPFSPLSAAYQLPVEGESASRILIDDIDYICCLAFSPNGETIVFASVENYALTLCSVRTGAKIAVFEGHTDCVNLIIFNPSGNRIASISDDKTARLWDAVTGQLVMVINLQYDLVAIITYFLDESVVTSSFLKGTVRLRDAFSLNSIATLEHDDEVKGILFTSDGNQIISITFSDLYIWDRTTFECRKKIKIPISEVYWIAISPNGEHLVALSNKGTFLWNKGADGLLPDDRLSSKLRFYASQAAFSPDSKSILFRNVTTSNSSEFGFFIYDLASRILIPVLNLDRSTYGFSPSPDFSSVAFSYDKQIRVAPLPQIHPVTLTVLSPNGDMAACVFSEGTVWLAYPKELPVVSKKLGGKVGKIIHLVFTSDNTFLAGVDDKFLYLWDTSTPELPRSASCKDLPPVTNLFFLKDKYTLATYHGDHGTNVWYTVDGTLLHSDASDISPCDAVCDSRLLLDCNESRVYKSGGAKFYLGKEQGPNSGIWAYVNCCLIRVRAGGSVTLLPLNSSEKFGMT